MADKRYETTTGDNANKTLALECAVRFLQKYPEFTQFVLNKSSYKFDIHALITEAKRLDLKAAVEDIRNEFEANGTSSELSDTDQCNLEHRQHVSPVLHNQLDAQTDDKETEVDNTDNESSDRKVFQDITNQLKQKYSVRKNKTKNNSQLEHCVFCLNNGADKEEYESHSCKDESGNVTCPVLQKFVCSRCHATGANAHTAKYCPLKPIITPEDCLVMEQKWLQKRRRRHAVTVKTNDMDEQRKLSGDTKSRTRLRF